MEIIQDQMALEKHQRTHGADFDSIELGRVDAYRHIVRLVTGVDIFHNERPVSERAASG